MVARLAPITTKKEEVFQLLLNGFRQRPTLPGRLQPSTIGTEGLNCCVRYGNRWDPFVITTGNCELVKQVRFLFPLAFARFRLCFPLRFGILSLFQLPVKCFPASLHPDNCTSNDSRLTVQLVSVRLLCFLCSLRSLALNQALDLLVSSSSICYHTSTDDLSTW